LGSGNIPVVTSPSGVAGAIQFSNGSAFASDASNFFWDDTNNRLGVGTNAPASQLEIKGNDDASFQISGGIAGRRALFSYFNAPSVFEFDVSNILRIKNGSTYSLYTDTTGSVGIGTLSPSARTHIKGSGSTSATTSLLVQNSAGTTSLQITDSNLLCLGGTTSSFPAIKRNGTAIDFRLADDSGFANINASIVDVKSILYVAGQVDFGGSDGRIVLPTAARGLCVSQDYSFPVSSALLEVKSTTKGFLPPRMTTTQKNAIASPAAGLIVYDSTLGKLCVRTASAWETITSL
jgi:hypothetical protein